jgi:hypothetical protein
MADVLVYLYAFGGAALRTVLPTGLVGIGGAPVRVVVGERLAAIVSSVDPLQFSVDPLRHNLQDLSWVAVTARTHHAVIDAVWRHQAIAPLRLATIYRDDDSVRALLNSRESEFLEVLNRIRGRQEWGVKAFAVSRDEPEPANEDEAGLGPGAAYLLRKRDVRERTSRRRRRVHDAAEYLHRLLAALAQDSRRYALQDPRLSGHPADLVLNAAYLIEESESAQFRTTLERWRSPDIRVELTGPWAPYSFATLEEK